MSFRKYIHVGWTWLEIVIKPFVTSSLDPVNSNFSLGQNSCSTLQLHPAVPWDWFRATIAEGGHPAGLPAFPSTANGWWCMVNDDGWCRFMWVISKLYVWLSMMFCHWNCLKAIQTSRFMKLLFPISGIIAITIHQLPSESDHKLDHRFSEETCHMHSLSPSPSQGY